MNPTRRRMLQFALAVAGSRAAVAQERPLHIYMILFRGETEVERGFRNYFAVRGIAATLVVRDIAGELTRIPALIAEARALAVDLIYTWGTSVTLAVVGAQKERNPARHVTDIPVVFVMVTSPENAGLVTTRSGGQRNFTGAVHVVPLDRQLVAMRAYRSFSRLAVVFNPAEPNSRQIVTELREAARRERFELIEGIVPLIAGQPDPAALPALVATLARQKPSLLYLGPDSFLATHRKVFTEAAVAAGLPIFSATERPLRDGKALFGLVSPYENVGQLAARKVEQILRRHIAPQDIAIETLGRFSYIVNMPVASALEFYPPLKVLNYAEIIR